ncbi:MAG: uncharacterized protein PWQ57_449 [Desulfovibrionales bacterium]|nr:uncharacterized protein [Desulfovibrionales bacterium]
MSKNNVPYRSPWRRYREDASPRRRGEQSFQVVVEQTDLWITAREDLSSQALDLVHGLRGTLKAYIALHPSFAASLAPVAVSPEAPPLIRSMALAGEACGVGPMAAVAGAIAQGVAEGLAQCSPDVLVENGGDVHMISTTDRVAALLADPASTAGLGLKLAAEDFPLSLCASSGRIGHSLSLGRGDLVVVRSKSAAVADAAATALGNLLQSKKDLERVAARARELNDKGVDGVFAQMDGRIAVWGKMELQVLQV